MEGEKEMTSIRCAAAFWAVVMFGAAAAHAEPVQVTGGRVEGRTDDGITSYLGIPFAASTEGENRWRAPQPIALWDGTMTADTFAPACIQNGAMLSMALGLSELETSEECLALNVWTPAESPDANLPVMVWIYGGAFTAGATSIPLTTGANLAQKDVVVVSVAYRVGALGFMAYPELSAESPLEISGNYGLLDMIAGLQWVHDNIAGFGGDPRRVTIFGESAGGIAVSMLSVSPMAEGLFHGVISESGGSFGPVGDSNGAGENVQSLAEAEAAGLGFARRLAAASLAELRALPADAIETASRTAAGVGWPIADGQVLPGDQYELYEAGVYHDVPILIGTNSDEGAMFTPPTDAAAHRANVQRRFGDYAGDVLEAYPATEEEAQRSARYLTRDLLFGWHTWAWANLQAATGESPVYLYYFDYVPPGGTNLPGLPAPEGANHGAEVSYVFGVFREKCG